MLVIMGAQEDTFPTAVAASEMDHLTCKPLFNSGKIQHSSPFSLKASICAISDLIGDRVIFKDEQRLAEVRLRTANSTLTLVPDEQWGLCRDSHENPSCLDALSETTTNPRQEKKKTKNKKLMSSTLIPDTFRNGYLQKFSAVTSSSYTKQIQPFFGCR